MMFTDPPYNCRIDGNACGRGSVKRREFAFASGEMGRAEFTGFLLAVLDPAAARLRHRVRGHGMTHMGELLSAGEQ